MRIDELPAQEKESQSTVNLLTVQIQELQDKVKSLSDSRVFCDPETASSSGLSHVPSHPMSIPSPRGMLSRDSCLQHDTRNSYGTSGNVFENLLAPNEPSAALTKFKKSCSGTMRARVSEHRKTFVRADDLDRNTQRFAILTARFARTFPTWNLPSHAEGAYQQNCMVLTPRFARTFSHWNPPSHAEHG